LDALSKTLSWPLFSIGDTVTTLGSLVVALAVIAATLILASIARKSVQDLVEKLHHEDAATSRIYGVITQLIIWVIGFELALHLVGIRLTTLFAATGFFAVAAGFAAKNIVENVFSGSILRLERIIRPGDLIAFDGRSLTVKQVGLRILTARTFDGEEVLIPNSLIAQSVVQNQTRGDRLNRIQIQVSVAYESDLAVVRKTLEETVDKIPWRSKTSSPAVYLREFGDSSVNYDVDVWLDDVKESRRRKSDLHELVWQALKEKDITIAYPQLDLHLDQSLPSSV
jgi:potassium efflux system protein